MAQQVLEGTWEEIAAHADRFIGKRVTVIAEADTVEADTVEAASSPNIGPPNMGPPNEPMLAALREIEERQTGRRHTSGEDTVDLIRQARNGGMYGREPLDE